MALFTDGAFNCLSEHLKDVPPDVRASARLVQVPINPLSAILEKHQVQKVDFLNIDCEGNDLAVLRSNDWSRWKPLVICVEDHAESWQQSETVRFLASVGYSLKYRAVFSSVFLPNEIALSLSKSRGLEPIV